MANSLPMGFRFLPTDQELVSFFLYNLVVKKEPLMPPYDAIIHNFNVFGSKLEPSEIWQKHGGPQLVGQQDYLYFFSELKRLLPKGAHIDRKIGERGTWSEGSVLKLIEVNGNPNPIGLKRKFRFEDEDLNSKDHGRWLLEEFSLLSDHKNQNTSKSYDFHYVICRMRRNNRFHIRKRKCPSEKDQLKTKKKQENKRMKKDDQLGLAESSQNAIVTNNIDDQIRSLIPTSNVSDVIGPKVLDNSSTFDADKCFAGIQVPFATSEAYHPWTFDNGVGQSLDDQKDWFKALMEESWAMNVPRF